MSLPAAAQRVLITGAGGWIGRYLSEQLGSDQRALRLFDIEPIDPDGLPGDVELITATVEDYDAVLQATGGVDAIVHLGGIPKEAAFADVVDVNVKGTYNVLEAARVCGVPRVVLASSNHVAGFQRVTPGRPLPDDVPARPDTYYGWSKAAIESLADLYADRFGMSIVSVRIAQFAERCSADQRGMALWLAPEDGVELFEAALTAAVSGHTIVWGVSGNSRQWLSLEGGAALGYHPEHDSEVFAAELVDPVTGELPPGTIDDRLGGHFCEVPLGVRMQPRVAPRR